MKEISHLFYVVEMFRNRLSRQLPTQHISLLLLVAERPGITQAELSNLLDMPQGTVSRNLKLLNYYLERDQCGSSAKGYGLLITRPLEEGAYPLGVFLTPKGEDFILDVVAELRSAPNTHALAC